MPVATTQQLEAATQRLIASDPRYATPAAQTALKSAIKSDPGALQKYLPAGVTVSAPASAKKFTLPDPNTWKGGVVNDPVTKTAYMLNPGAQGGATWFAVPAGSNIATPVTSPTTNPRPMGSGLLVSTLNRQIADSQPKPDPKVAAAAEAERKAAGARAAAEATASRQAKSLAESQAQQQAQKVAAEKAAAEKAAAEKAAAEAKAATEKAAAEAKATADAKIAADKIAAEKAAAEKSASIQNVQQAQNALVASYNAGTTTQADIDTYTAMVTKAGGVPQSSLITRANYVIENRNRATIAAEKAAEVKAAKDAKDQADAVARAEAKALAEEKARADAVARAETQTAAEAKAQADAVARAEAQALAKATAVKTADYQNQLMRATTTDQLNNIVSQAQADGITLNQGYLDRAGIQIQQSQARNEATATQQAEQAAIADRAAAEQAARTQANYARTADWLKTTPPTGQQARLPNGETVYSIPANPVTGAQGGWYRSVETTPGQYSLQQIGADGAPTGPAIPGADFTRDQQAQEGQIRTYNQQNAEELQTKTFDYEAQLARAKTSADVARIVEAAQTDGVTLNQGRIDQANNNAEQTQAQLALKSQQELQTLFDDKAYSVRTQADLDQVLEQAQKAGVTVGAGRLQQAQNRIQQSATIADFASRLGPPTGSDVIGPNGSHFYSIADDPITGVKGGWYQDYGNGDLQAIGKDGYPTSAVTANKEYNQQAADVRANIGQYEITQRNTANMNDFLSARSEVESKLPAPGSPGWMQGGYKTGPSYTDAYGQTTIRLTYYPVPPDPATGSPGGWAVSSDDLRTWQPVGQSGVAGQPAGPSISFKELGTISNNYAADLDRQSRARFEEARTAQNTPKGGDVGDIFAAFDDLVNDTIGWKTIASMAGSYFGGPWGAALARSLAGAVAGEDLGTIAKSAALTFAASYGTQALGEALASGTEAAAADGVIDSTAADTFTSSVDDVINVSPELDPGAYIPDLPPELDPGAYIPDLPPELDPGAYIPDPVAPVIPDLPVDVGPVTPYIPEPVGPGPEIPGPGPEIPGPGPEIPGPGPEIPGPVGPVPPQLSELEPFPRQPDLGLPKVIRQPITDEFGEIVGFETPNEIANNIINNAPVEPISPEPFGPPDVTDVVPVRPPEIVTNDIGERFVLNPDGTMTPYQDPNMITTPGLPTTEPVLTPVGTPTVEIMEPVAPTAPTPLSPGEQYYKDLVDGGMDIKEASDLTDLRFPRPGSATVEFPNETYGPVGTGPVGPVTPSDLPVVSTYGGLQPGEIVATLTPEQIAIMGGSAAALATVTAVISAGGNPATVIPPATATPAPTAPTTTAPTTAPVTPEPVIAPVEPPPVIAPEPVAPPVTPVEPAPVAPPVAPEPVPIDTPVIPVVTPPVAPPVPPVEPVPVTPPPVEPVPITPPPVEPVPVTPPPVEPVPVTPTPVEPVPITPPPVEPVPVTPPVTPTPVEPVPVTPPVEPVTPPVEVPVTPPVVPPVTPGPATPPGPVTELPVTPGPVTELPVTPGPVTPGPVTPGPTTPGPTTPGPTTPGPTTPGPTTPGPTTPGPTTPGPTGPETPVIIPPVTPAPVTPTPVTPTPVTPTPPAEPPVTTDPPKPYEPYEPDYPVQPEPWEIPKWPLLLPLLRQPPVSPTMRRNPYPIPYFDGGGLINPGLNPGYLPTAVNPPMYQTTNPYQSQYYWGQHPYMQSQADLPYYNDVPEAPAVPFGLQAGPNFDWNQYLSQLAATPVGPVAPGTGNT